jgi:hypothetical protein
MVLTVCVPTIVFWSRLLVILQSVLMVILQIVLMVILQIDAEPLSPDAKKPASWNVPRRALKVRLVS